MALEPPLTRSSFNPESQLISTFLPKLTRLLNAEDDGGDDDDDDSGMALISQVWILQCINYPLLAVYLM
jgi:hypothetical protein